MSLWPCACLLKEEAASAEKTSFLAILANMGLTFRKSLLTVTEKSVNITKWSGLHAGVHFM